MRLSRGRSTPTRRAIRSFFPGPRGPVVAKSWCTTVPAEAGLRLRVRRCRPARAGVGWCGVQFGRTPTGSSSYTCGSALALLVAQVLADDHDPAVTADHLALVADLLDARLDLHRPAVLLEVVGVGGGVSGNGRRCGRGTGRTG